MRLWLHRHTPTLHKWQAVAIRPGSIFGHKMLCGPTRRRWRVYRAIEESGYRFREPGDRPPGWEWEVQGWYATAERA